MRNAVAGPIETLSPQICQRALEARDPRFDGVFFVAITTTRIYCRPICPSRRAAPGHRRFFPSAAAAEREGFRPCLRCRPELAPGRAWVDALSRLASVAAHRIAAGALNGRSVKSLANDLNVSERHLRRALHDHLGVSPVELAQTHRLLLAKQLLADTTLSVTRIAFASGFQSLRRFNVVFRERYRMSPTDLRRFSSGITRRVPRPRNGHGRFRETALDEPVRITLAYRPPFTWDHLLAALRRDATPGVEVVAGRRYGRTVQLGSAQGCIVVVDAPSEARIRLEISPSLLPALMPLLTRVRRLLDLDAQPDVIDAHLAAGGLRWLVQRRPGIRVPGPFDGFEVAMLALLAGRGQSPEAVRHLAARLTWDLGAPLPTGVPLLERVMPTASRIADAGPARLIEMGVGPRRGRILVALARAVAADHVRLEPGNDPESTRRALLEIDGIGERLATTIAMRALYWPDAFSSADRTLQRAANTNGEEALRTRAEQWRPWRAYAAMHLWMHACAG